MTDIPIHRTNAATLELIQRGIRRWTAELEAANTPIDSYFITIDFNGLSDPERKLFFNQIPTSFSLNDEQVDQLLGVGKELLQSNPEFKRLINDLPAT